jgi:hypothetical protein
MLPDELPLIEPLLPCEPWLPELPLCELPPACEPLVPCEPWLPELPRPSEPLLPAPVVPAVPIEPVPPVVLLAELLLPIEPLLPAPLLPLVLLPIEPELPAPLDEPLEADGLLGLLLRPLVWSLSLPMLVPAPWPVSRALPLSDF